MIYAIAIGYTIFAAEMAQNERFFYLDIYRAYRKLDYGGRLFLVPVPD